MKQQERERERELLITSYVAALSTWSTCCFNSVGLKSLHRPMTDSKVQIALCPSFYLWHREFVDISLWVKHRTPATQQGLQSFFLLLLFHECKGEQKALNKPDFIRHTHTKPSTSVLHSHCHQSDLVLRTAALCSYYRGNDTTVQSSFYIPHCKSLKNQQCRVVHFDNNLQKKKSLAHRWLRSKPQNT